MFGVMKRFVTITTGCIIIAYIVLTLYSISPLYANYTPVRKIAISTKKMLGMGRLFTSKNAAVGKSVSYRFYKNGKWSKSQLLLEPLFNRYLETGNVASLKHCRLDAYLSRDIHRIAQKNGIEKMRQSKEYAEFIDHLFYRHNNDIRPDSLQVQFYVRDYKTDSLHLTLTFKSKT